MRQTTLSPERIERVMSYINATKTHTATGDNDLELFLDFDLSILGSEDAIYDVYTRQIREEFSVYPTFVYKTGRKKAMRNMLERSYIFKTDEFRRRFEAKARENIQRELDTL